MPTSTAAQAAIDYFTAEARNFLSPKSTVFRSKVGDIKQSGRPLATAKAALRTLRTRFASPAASTPACDLCDTPAPEDAQDDPETTQEVPEEPVCYAGSASPLTLKQALAEPDVFTQGGVTVIECALAREKAWIDPAERRIVARLRKAVARGDRSAFDRAVAAMDYLGSNPVLSTAWRKAERAFEAPEEIRLPVPQISLGSGEVPVVDPTRVPDRPEEASGSRRNRSLLEPNSESDMVLAIDAEPTLA